MDVNVLLFAGVRAASGADEATVELAPDATVADLRRALAERWPQAAALLAVSRFAVDQSYAPDDAPVPPDAEIACIPPVSGG